MLKKNNLALGFQKKNYPVLTFQEKNNLARKNLQSPPLDIKCGAPYNYWLELVNHFLQEVCIHR